MKKLIMAAAAITAGFAMADVVSSSVVGYLTKDVEQGYSMLTPSFEAIGDTTYDIDNFVMNGVEDTAAEIQVMNAAGSWIGDYFWYNEFTDGTTTYPAGWFEIGGENAANISLEPGSAVFFYTSQAGVTIQSAGQVAGAVTNDVATGYSMIGNSTPVAINADSLEVIGVEDTAAEIQVMNAAGSWVGDYFWYNEFNDGTTTYPAGWFEIGGENSADLTLQPGDSVFFYTSATGAKVVIPSTL